MPRMIHVFFLLDQNIVCAATIPDCSMVLRQDKVLVQRSVVSDHDSHCMGAWESEKKRGFSEM